MINNICRKNKMKLISNCRYFFLYLTYMRFVRFTRLTLCWFQSKSISGVYYKPVVYYNRYKIIKKCCVLLKSATSKFEVNGLGQRNQTNM